MWFGYYYLVEMRGVAPLSQSRTVVTCYKVRLFGYLSVLKEKSKTIKNFSSQSSWKTFRQKLGRRKPCLRLEYRWHRVFLNTSLIKKSDGCCLFYATTGAGWRNFAWIFASTSPTEVCVPFIGVRLYYTKIPDDLRFAVTPHSFWSTI